MTIGTGAGGQLSAATDLKAGELTAVDLRKLDKQGQLPDGVLAPITGPMLAGVGMVAGIGMLQAGFNLGRFVYDILHLPMILAIGFPVIFELAAAIFAIQDARDRRQGHKDRLMEAATYVTLVASSVVNGIVGWSTHQAAGLIEVFPPLFLALVIHVQGRRANRAYHSQAVLRPSWRTAQLKAARRESVMSVLPLLTGDDEHGKATVELLRGRLTSETLEPGEALLAAGWDKRGERNLTPSMLRRLETVAATVWGSAGPPAPTGSASSTPAAPTGSSGSPVVVRRSRSSESSDGSAKRSTVGSTGGSISGSTDGSTRGSMDRESSGSTINAGDRSTASGGSTGKSSDGSTRTLGELRARTTADLWQELQQAIRDGHLSADSNIKQVRQHLRVAPYKARELHAQLQSPDERIRQLLAETTPAPTAEAAAAPPQLRVLPLPEQDVLATEGGDQDADPSASDVAAEDGR